MCLENTEVPIRSPTIAKTFGDAMNIWKVKEGLQRLKEIDVVNRKENGWVLSKSGMCLPLLKVADFL